MGTARIEIDQDIQPLSEFRKHAADFIDRIKNKNDPLFYIAREKCGCFSECI